LRKSGKKAQETTKRSTEKMRKMKNNAGFSLVELIVVIAIMAILAGVGVAGYSIYTTESKKGVDRDTVAEVIRALEMGYNSGELTEAGYVVLSLDSAPTFSSDPIKERLEMAFGEKTNTLRLVYDGWNGSYGSSSFNGNEVALLGKVEGLTEALSAFLTEHPESLDPTGEGFEKYMSEELGFSATDITNPDKAADAAVLYVANGTANLTDSQKANFVNVVKNVDSSDIEELLRDMLNGFNGVYNNPVQAAAASYAMMTAYIQYADSKISEDLMGAWVAADGTDVDATDIDAMFDYIMGSFEVACMTVMGPDDEYPPHWEQYWASEAEKDAKAYIDLMGTAINAKGQVQNNLGQSGCFTSATLGDLFEAYGEGKVIILSEINADGTVSVYPMPEME
jgi:prepilin-type N-terminal cleavage/methylation domain-containing protein